MKQKGHYLILTLLVLTACSQQKPNRPALDALKLETGYQLNYNLTYNEQRYQFIVDLLEWSPYRKFKYTMTNKGHTHAVMTLRPEAVQSANKMVNTFNGKNDSLDHDALTIWWSKQMFDDLLRKDTVVFNDGSSLFGKPMTTYYLAGTQPYAYELNGFPQRIEVLVAKALGGSHEFWILNDPENPLIIRMDVGWVIWLKEVNFS